MRAPLEPDTPQVLPPVTARELVEHHGPLIARIRLAYGATVPQFEVEVMPLVHRFADYVHALPTAFGSSQTELGGLLRASLQASLYCLQGAEARIFTGHASISERRMTEPHWRMAAFLTGLCCELHSTLCWSVQRDGTEAWPRYRQPLASWLQSSPGAVHRASRAQHGSVPTLNAVLLPHVVPADVIQDLSGTDGEVLSHLVSALGGLASPGQPGPLLELGRSALSLVAANGPQDSGSGAPRIWHSEPMVRFGVQGLRQLAAQRSNWQVNAARSRVWWGSDGLFLQWPEAAEDLVQLLLNAQVAGVPAQPSQWLVLLCGCGMLAGPAHEAVRLIQPPAPTPQIRAVRAAHPGWLLDEHRHGSAPLQGALAHTPQSLHASATAPESPAEEAPRASDNAPVESPAVAEPEAAAQEAPREGAAPALPAAAPAPWTLRAPLRLPPRVRDVLQDVLRDLQAGLALRAWHLTDGIFVSADEWTSRGLPAHSAARALQSCGMTGQEANGGTALTVRRTNAGEQVGTLIGNAYLDMGAAPPAPNT